MRRGSFALRDDLAALVRPVGATALLALALFVQVAFWYVGSPGPHSAGAERTPAAALVAVGWAVLLLGLVPLVALRLRAVLPAGLGLGWGDARFGAIALFGGGAIAIPALYVATRSAELQATYPWPGAAAGAGLGAFAAWAAAYAAYYVAFEFFYRGFLLRLLEPLWGIGAAIWFQAAASTLLHLGKPWVETVGALPFGLLMAVVAVRGRSLLWPVALHLTIGLATDLFALHHSGSPWP